MKKRILFVDDEPNVLSGLRRSLHGMRENWDMQFVESAAAALQALEKEPYDAIVSDMRMPLMDGADLLDQVKQRYPDTVRMILSGQASRGAMFRSIAPAHQFLSKPCDPQELANRLSQAFAMRDLLSNQSVKTVVSRMRSIPSLPALYEEVMAQLRSEEPSFAQIARIISKDVGMATKILQLANSAFMGTSGRVSSLLQALTLIGLDNVRTLVLSVNVFSQFDGNARVAASLPCLWDHSIAVSKAGAADCRRRELRETAAGGVFHRGTSARSRQAGSDGGIPQGMPAGLCGKVQYDYRRGTGAPGLHARRSGSVSDGHLGAALSAGACSSFSPSPRRNRRDEILDTDRGP